MLRSLVGSEMCIRDRVAPSSDANIDVGLIMHYYSGSAKKAAVFWDDSVSRVVIASDVSESTSVLTAAAHAALETGALWIKDAAGTTETIGHDGRVFAFSPDGIGRTQYPHPTRQTTWTRDLPILASLR